MTHQALLQRKASSHSSPRLPVNRKKNLLHHTDNQLIKNKIAKFYFFLPFKWLPFFSFCN